MRDLGVTGSMRRAVNVWETELSSNERPPIDLPDAALPGALAELMRLSPGERGHAFERLTKWLLPMS